MQNIIISHSHWRNIIDHTIFVGQNNLTDRESWSVGSCTDGWEFDTENYHRLLILFLLQIFYSTEIWTMPKSPVSLYSMKSQINCQRYELGVRGCLGSCNVSGFNHFFVIFFSVYLFYLELAVNLLSRGCAWYALLWMVLVRQRSKNLGFCAIFFVSATTMAACQPSSSPTWLLWPPESPRLSSQSIYPSLSSGNPFKHLFFCDLPFVVLQTLFVDI